MSPVCNATLEHEVINETPLAGGLTFHGMGLIVSAVFGLIAVVLSVYLMFMHATHYLKPHEQKHIIRILFMVPIYAIVSFLSYYFYLHTIYYEVLRDCYEAFAIASFFSLLSAYIAPSLHDQKEYFRTIRPKDWIWPLKWGKWKMIKNPPRSGLTWFNIIFFCVFQYCFVRVFMTVVAVLTQATGRYCLESLNPAFAHVWIEVIEGAAVTVAMYCLIQYYVQLKNDVAEHRPLLKVLAIKGVIFLTFWQTIILDFAVSSGRLAPTPQISRPDLQVGLNSILLCIEMALFAVLHLWAYPWKEYDLKHSEIVASETAGGFDSQQQIRYKGGAFGYKAFLEAYNPWDIIKAVGRGARWMAVGRRYREQDDSYTNSRKGTALEDARTGLTANSSKNGAYQKLDSPGGSRDHSPSRNDRPYYSSAAEGYDGSGQKYGVTTQHGYERPGTTGGEGTAQYASQQNSVRYDGGAHDGGAQHAANAYSASQYGASSYDAVDAGDTAYHGASSASRPNRGPAPGYAYEPGQGQVMDMPDPDSHQWR